jgi:hypothetical protein
MPSNFKDIITRLERQKAAIDKALAALHEFDDGDAAESATPKKSVAKKAVKKRVLSEEGRQRIAEAARKRWASKKRASKKLASAA